MVMDWCPPATVRGRRICRAVSCGASLSALQSVGAVRKLAGLLYQCFGRSSGQKHARQVSSVLVGT
jgi:hypothetical protein